MGCATGLVKTLVFLLNFLCSIVGLVLITLGSISFAFINKVDAATKQSNTFVPTFFLALGVIIFVISFLGCCGVFQKSQCMLTTYAVILILLFVIQLGISIFGFVSLSGSDDPKNTVKTEIHSQLETMFQDYSTNKTVTDLFNDFQYNLDCCGVDGPQDYAKVLFPIRYPPSCCGHDDKTECLKPVDQGCSNVIYDYVIHYLKVISYVAIGVCATELFAALFAICLVNSYRNEARRNY